MGKTGFEIVDKKPKLGGRKLPEIPEEIKSKIRKIKKRIKKDFKLNKRIGHIKEKDMPTEKKGAHETSYFKENEVLKEKAKNLIPFSKKS